MRPSGSIISPLRVSRWKIGAALASAYIVLAMALTGWVTPVGASARPILSRLPAGVEAVAKTAQTPNITKGPLAWDTYRHLDQLPTLPIGVQTQQFASTDPNGQNMDFNHTLGRAPDGSYILAQHGGPGEIDAIWTTSNGGDVTQTGNIRVTLDGHDVLNAPEQNVVNGALGAPFTFPLVANANQSSGGNYIDVPMPYQSSMQVTTTNDPVYYHVDYRNFADAAGVSTFNPGDPVQDVVSELAAAGTTDPKGPQPGQVTSTPPIVAIPGQTDTLESFQGPARINALQLTLPQLSLTAVAPAASPATVASGATVLPINPNSGGVRVTRRLQSGAGTEETDVVVDGKKVATIPPPPPGAASSAHWAAQSINLPASVTTGHPNIQVVPSGSGSTFAYQVTNQPSPSVAAATAISDDVLQNVRLRITFDGQQTVDAPLGQFFGSGLAESTVNSLMVAVNVQNNTLSAWWPMPYAQQATIAVYNGSQQTLSGTTQITTAPVSGEAQALGSSGQDGYFHATANAQNPTVSGQDYSFLSAGAWGKFVGVSETMRPVIAQYGSFLEGNEHVFVDGSPSPQIDGTGTEDFYQGGWYFNRGPFSNPLNGAPAIQSTGACVNLCVGAYRLMFAEAVPFSNSISFGIQHGPVNTTPSNYSSTAFWYGRSGPSSMTGVEGSDGALYIRAPGAGNLSLGGILAGAPAIAAVPQASGPPLPLYVVTGSDHRLWVRSDGQGFQPLTQDFTYCIDNPAAVVTGSAGAATLTVACQGGDHALYTIQGPVSAGNLPALSGWTGHGGALVAGPAVAPVGAGGDITFFVDGTDGHVWAGAASTPFTQMPWLCLGHPAVATLGSTATFACDGTNHALWFATNTGTGWSSPQSLGGILVDGLGLAAVPGGTTLFVEGSDSALWQNFIPDGGNPTGWAGDGGAVRQGAGAVGLR